MYTRTEILGMSILPQPRWNTSWDGIIEEDTSHWPEYNDIILIRHGQYHNREEPHILTAVGDSQAKSTGGYLQALVQRGELKIGSIVHSEITRAVQTATVINRQLSSTHKLEESDLLNEGTLPAKVWKCQLIKVSTVAICIIIHCYVIPSWTVHGS